MFALFNVNSGTVNIVLKMPDANVLVEFQVQFQMMVAKKELE